VGDPNLQLDVCFTVNKDFDWWWAEKKISHGFLCGTDKKTEVLENPKSIKNDVGFSKTTQHHGIHSPNG
jgi:hypothetical protein